MNLSYGDLQGEGKLFFFSFILNIFGPVITKIDCKDLLPIKGMVVQIFHDLDINLPHSQNLQDNITAIP